MQVKKQQLESDMEQLFATPNLFQIGKGICQGCILSLCSFNLYAEYIMQNARLDEAQAGIKVARKNISNLRYLDNTTLMVQSSEESEKVGLKLNNQKTKIVCLVPSFHGK